jgi:hypothetical protein
MKNIHILPTNKPSRLCYVICTENSTLTLFEDVMEKSSRFFPQHIYITSNEEIKDGEWVLNVMTLIRGEYFIEKATVNHNKSNGWKKIILTTDLDLIKDGVQGIPDEFFKNPTCEFVEIDKKQLDSHFEFFEYKIIIPKEEPTMVDKLKEYFKNTPKEQVQKDWEESCKATEGINSPTVDELIEAQKSFNKQETLEGAVKEYCLKKYGPGYYPDVEKGCLFGAKWQAKRMYSEEDMREAIRYGFDKGFCSNSSNKTKNLGLSEQEWFEQFKKK